MKKTQLGKILRKQLFWDIDFSGMDADKNKRLIIQRVFSRGNVQEVRAVIDFYGKETIIETLTNLNYLDPKTLNFVSLIFHIRKAEFQCYTRRQSIPQHWNS